MKNVINVLYEALIAYTAIFAMITLYGICAGDVELVKNAKVTLIICLILEILT